MSAGVPLSPPRWTAAIAITLTLGGSGCVKVYQPLSGLHNAVVIDTSVANFQDVNLDIYCPPGKLLDRSEASMLCRYVGQLFENQGANVSTAVRDLRRLDAEPEAGADDQAAVAPRSTDLVLELRARELTASRDPLTWLLSLGTFTLVPAVSEFTFAQDVVIRDGSGFLLVSETLRGRVVQRFGLGAWGGNLVLDAIWRSDDEDIVGFAVERDLSADLYGRLSQLVFNAKMRSNVLQEGPTVPGPAQPAAGSP